jgi:hypothetical protein
LFCAEGQRCCDQCAQSYCERPDDGVFCPDDEDPNRNCPAEGTGGFPICAAPDTPIATPDGERPIADLVPGDLVYSVTDSAIVAVRIQRVNRTPVFEHEVVEVMLVDGTRLQISAGHPTADGRTFADLQSGGLLDGTRVVSAHRVPYQHAFTYDILPASESGTYFAGGALIGSTLKAGR